MNYKIGICDADAHYSVSLMEYINTHANIPLQCAAFSNVRAISEYAETSRLDLVLLDESMECDIALPCVRMTELQSAEEGTTYIYKYQKIADIASQIMRILGVRDKGVQSELRIYGIYSPLGRCGKTSLAMGICDRYQNSLYIGLEEYCGISEEFFRGAKKLSENFLYFWLNKNEEALNCIEAAPKTKSGFTVLCGADCYQGYRLLCKGHIEWLCDVLRDKSAFNRIVFDIGTGTLSEMEILSCFDCVLLPILEDAVSQQKVRRFMDFVNGGIFAVPTKRIISIHVPPAEYDSDEMRACIETGGI